MEWTHVVVYSEVTGNDRKSLNKRYRFERDIDKIYGIIRSKNLKIREDDGVHVYEYHIYLHGTWTNEKISKLLSIYDLA